MANDKAFCNEHCRWRAGSRVGGAQVRAVQSTPASRAQVNTTLQPV